MNRHFVEASHSTFDILISTDIYQSRNSNVYKVLITLNYKSNDLLKSSVTCERDKEVLIMKKKC
ncbi:CLUMA_CG017313, isoform A [Clunio marinus]|uniref:CLUMA_CG017313, isoform A n=1 Tax=Clunio marinus TaxID=568069 RepID=A0A1J1IVA2_9DIPT|nr:CLUMA_CG017313, isoform A [Clunio marinus]